MADRAPLLCSSGRKGGFVPAFPAKDLRHSDWTGSGRMPSLEPIILAEGHGWRQFLWKLMDPRMEFWGLMERGSGQWMLGRHQRNVHQSI